MDNHSGSGTTPLADVLEVTLPISGERKTNGQLRERGLELLGQIRDLSKLEDRTERTEKLKQWALDLTPDDVLALINTSEWVEKVAAFAAMGQVIKAGQAAGLEHFFKAAGQGPGLEQFVNTNLN